MATPIKFPIVVRQGSVAVKIYRTPTRSCESFTLAYYQDGIRKRPTFTSLQAAPEQPNIVTIRLGNADADALTLTSADRAAYPRARQLLDGVGAHIGKQVLPVNQ